MQRILPSIILIITTLGLLGCSNQSQDAHEAALPFTNKPDLVIYSGITMVRPLLEVANEFEKKYHVKIAIEQGASSYLFETIRSQKTGDIYFPGSSYFRKAHLKDNILLEHKLVGYNRLAIVTTLDNKNNIPLKLESLINPDYAVALPAPNSSSVGQATEKLLTELNLKQKAYQNAAFFTTDSHHINQSIILGRADIALNWHATTRWDEAKGQIHSTIIDESISPKRELELNLLRYSKNPKLAKLFIHFATEEKSLLSFYKFGFLTDEEFQNLNSHYQKERGLTK